MKKLTGAEILVECLLEQGVDTVFGYPGGAVLHIYDALYEYADRINHFLTAHEQGAAHAADGYARSSGKTGVVIATSGPGATNLVTGIATAYMDSVPMVAITGNVALSLLGLDSFQEVDITGITMPITKHNFIVKSVDDLADTVRDAFRIANEGRKGPVLIDIPKDITMTETVFKAAVKKDAESHINIEQDDDIAKALEIIKEAERPFIYTGGGVIASGASEQIRAFAQLMDAPVASSLMGQGGYDNTLPNYIGMLGMHGTKTSSLAIGECDLFVAIGTRFSDRVIGNASTFARNARIIHIDIDPAEVNKNIEVYHKVVGDIAQVLDKINSSLPQQSHENWLDKIKEWKSEFPLVQIEEHDEFITPQYVIETLDELLGERAIITTEVGQHQMWAAQFYNFRSPRSFITSGGLGTMGYGLGASLGAQVARPDRQVVNIAGDGSFHMNCNELVTASKYNIPIIELIFNNNVLGMVRQWQRLFYSKRFSHTTLDRPTDYVKLAEAFGIKAYVIEKKSQVKTVLQKAIKSKSPVLIDCRIDKDINVLPMVPAGKSVEDIILEIED